MSSGQSMKLYLNFSHEPPWSWREDAFPEPSVSLLPQGPPEAEGWEEAFSPMMRQFPSQQPSLALCHQSMVAWPIPGPHCDKPAGSFTGSLCASTRLSVPSTGRAIRGQAPGPCSFPGLLGRAVYWGLLPSALGVPSPSHPP